MTTESPKRKRGKQPFQRTPEIEEEILERLANGEPLAKICRDAHTPSVVTVWEWEKADADFSERVARARQAGHDQIALDSMMIADTQEIGVIRKIEGDKVTETHEDMLGHRKLRVDTRLKLLACWDPKRYGGRVQLDGEVTHVHDVSKQSALVDAVLAKLVGE